MANGRGCIRGLAVSNRRLCLESTAIFCSDPPPSLDTAHLDTALYDGEKSGQSPNALCRLYLEHYV